jgi:hypothetical protein
MLPTVQYGPWCPTNHLRWNNGALEQKMRRKVKRHESGGPSWNAGYEYEWQKLPVVIT